MTGTDVNRIELVGNLGSSPKLARTRHDDLVATLSLATRRSWTDREGGIRSATEWHTVVVRDPASAKLCERLAKGAHVRIVGRLEYREVKVNDFRTARGTRPSSVASRL